MRLVIRPVVVATALGLTALIAACGGDQPASTSTPAPAATTPAVSSPATAAATPSPSATAAAASSTPAASATPTASATATAAATTPVATATRAATAAPTAAPSVGGATVDIANFLYVGAGTVSVGGTVSWTNSDALEHDVTFKDGTASPYLTQRQTYSRKFDAAGSFEYLCSIHPFMVGTVTVR